ncbi:MAG: glycosyltransferase family 2 protein [Elusimicrobia bacterium]|nr:glycosyltransferase family 2 protein [Candidatus Obscuribacterium magneticum]
MLGYVASNRNELNQALEPELSVVVPVCNEAQNIRPLFERLRAVLSKLASRYEIVCVDDGSRDNSFNLICREAELDPRTKAVSLSRNFGHQIAITAGLEFSSGAAVVIIDSDLQDPPEVIPELVGKWKEGYDVVYAVRRRRKGESLLKLFTAKVFYRVMSRAAEFDIPLDAGDFRLLSRNVVNVLLSMPEYHRFMRGLSAWTGFRQTGVPYDRAERAHGRTKYNYKKMLRFAFDGITALSILPLRLASYLGFFSIFLAFLPLLSLISAKVIGTTFSINFSSLHFLILFLGGIQLLAIGLLGEYVGRVHTEAKRRPLYVVGKTVNVEKNSQASLPV